MSAPRITPLSHPLPEPVASRLAKLLPPGMPAPQLFLTVARNEGSFVKMVDSGFLGPTGLWDRRMLTPTLRETLILRTCVATHNHYEFNLHVQTISERMGLSRAQIDDIRHASPAAALWQAAEIAAMRLVDALVASLAVDDAEFALLREHFDEATLIEMTQLVGFYTGVAMLVGLARPDFDRYHPGPPEKATP